MTKRRTRKSTGRGSKTSLFLAVAVGVVLIIQYGLGINLLGKQEDNKNQSGTTTAPVVTAPPVATSVSGGTPVANSGVVAIPGGIDGGWFQLYFTSPINTTDESRFTGAPIENAMVKVIDGAQQKIDLAAFQFNSQPVTDALLRAKNRGVQIRMVVDGDFTMKSPDSTIDQLETVGISIVSDGTRGAYMHDKFMVIDGQYVWTGSTNFTVNDIYNNNNSSIFIRSTQLAQNYTDEFNELFAKQFGITSPNTVANPSINLNGTQIETIFEAEGDLPTRLVQLINSSNSIRFMAFSLTRTDLMNALLARMQAGADVMGIVEASGRRFSKPLFCGGLDIKQDGNPDVLHSKNFIFNGQTVVIGSFNFSDSAANQNDENTLIITNPDIAQAYLQEFARRWAEAQTVPLSNFGC